MKDELQTKLVEILSSIQNAAGKAGDFAMAQLPDIAQSYVVYGRVLYTIAIIIGAALIAGSILLFLAGNRMHARGQAQFENSAESKYPSLYRDKFDQGYSHWRYAFWVWLAGMFAFCGNISSFVLVWVAPKVWLLKELASLVK